MWLSLGHWAHTHSAQRLVLSTQHVLTKVMWLGHVLLEVVNLHTQPHTFSSLKLMVYPLSILTVSFLELAWPVGKAGGQGLMYVLALPLTSEKAWAWGLQMPPLRMEIIRCALQGTVRVPGNVSVTFCLSFG